MAVIFILIGVSLCLAIFFLISFFWAIKSGQYDDDYTPSIRILQEDLPGQESQKSNKSINGNRKV